ncbi:MAG: tRNA methyl transferase PRC-barrel domain-containing protein [Weeksellaceae bacterium]
MNKIGQIVEIPASSSIYNPKVPTFSTIEEEVIWKTNRYDYNLFDGILIGGHHGLDEFKYGQRKGINVGGQEKPLYVIGKNFNDNQLFVGAGKDHPGLWPTIFKFDEGAFHWMSDTFKSLVIDQSSLSVEIKNHALGEDSYKALLWLLNEKLYIQFNHKVKIDIKNHPLQIYHTNKLIIETL